MKSIILLLLLVPLFYSCKTGYKSVTDAEGQKIYNVHYGPEENQVMDVFIPKTIAPDKPFAIIIHGGAWTLGSKKNIRMTQKYLMREGIPSANMNYRLADDTNHLDEQLIDIQLVVDMLNRDLPKYNLKPDKYTLIGESSGGHIALLYGYTHPENTKNIVAFFPPTNFTEKTGNKLVANLSRPIMKKLLGTGSKEMIAKALTRASPINRVTNVPTLIFHGTWDFIVNKRQAFSLDSVLAKKNVTHKLVIVERGTHFMRLNGNTRKNILYPELLKWIFQDYSKSLPNDNAINE